MSLMLENTRQCLVIQVDRAKHCRDMLERCQDALDEAKGLAGDISGVPCSEYIRMAVAHVAAEASLMRASLDHLSRKLQGFSYDSGSGVTDQAGNRVPEVP